MISWIGWDPPPFRPKFKNQLFFYASPYWPSTALYWQSTRVAEVVLRHEEPSPKSLDLDENCPCYFLWKSFSATSSSCSCLSLICQKNQLFPISRLITSVSNSVLPYDVIRGMPEWMVDWTKVMDGNVQLAPLPLLKRTQTWPYANSQTQNISGMALILPLKRRIWPKEWEENSK